MRRNPVSQNKCHQRQRDGYGRRAPGEMEGQIAGRAIILLGTEIMMMLRQRDQLQAEQRSQEKIQCPTNIRPDGF
ncbi:MAG: hypothetical protein V4563_06390 [Pseudomonadota bacterium]